MTRDPQLNPCVLVTGGLGFIGSHVVQLLAERGIDCAILDWNTEARSLALLRALSNVKGIYHLDICSGVEAMDAAIPSDLTFTHVVHLAAAISVAESVIDPKKYERTNVAGSSAVYALAARRGAVAAVSASSAAVYGDPDNSLLPIKESTPIAGISPYALSKADMERLAQGITNPKLHFLRFFNVFGPRQDPNSPYTGVVSIFLSRAAQGLPLTIFGDGKQTRDFVYVRDVGRAILQLLLDRDFTLPALTMNVGTERSTSVLQLAETAVRLSQRDSSISFGPRRDGDIVDSVACCSLIHKELGWSPTVSVHEGLEATLRWMEEDLQATD
jgi:UDP-glucose 4-epimerase